MNPNSDNLSIGPNLNDPPSVSLRVDNPSTLQPGKPLLNGGCDEHYLQAGQLPTLPGSFSESITERQLEILQHTVGVDKYGRGEMYRNHFCAGVDDEIVEGSGVAMSRQSGRRLMVETVTNSR